MENRLKRNATRGRPKRKKKYIKEETKQGFLQGVLTLMFSQILIKLLGMLRELNIIIRTIEDRPSKVGLFP